MSVLDRYRAASDAWSRIEAEFLRQQSIGQWDENLTDIMMTDAHANFDEALSIAPQSLTELQSYLAMLRTRDIRESPASVETALATMEEALAGLVTAGKRRRETKRSREIEFALWSLTFALYEEKCGFSNSLPSRIREALRRGRELIQERDEEFRPLIDESDEAPSLFRNGKGPASRS